MIKDEDEMKIKNKEEIQKIFKDFIAEKHDYGEIVTIFFYNPKSSNMNIKFIFDRQLYTLSITGDAGELIAQNKDNMTPELFRNHYCNYPFYFREKIQTMRNGVMQFSVDLFWQNLEEYIAEAHLSLEQLDAKAELKNELEFNQYGPIVSHYVTGLLDTIDPVCWQEWFYDCGWTPNFRINQYLVAFEMADDYLKHHKKKKAAVS